MIKIKDSFKLASIKFRTRKLRNLFSGCSVALGVVTIIVFLLAGNALNSLLQAAFKDSTANRYFSMEMISSYSKDINEVPEPMKELSESEYKSRQSKYKIKKLYKEYSANPKIEIPGLTPKDDSDTRGNVGYSSELSLAVLDKIFVEDYIDNNLNISFDKYFEKDGEKVIPVIIPKEYVLNQKLGTQDINLSTQQKYERSQDVLSDYLGTVLDLKITDVEFSTERTEEIREIGSTKLDLKVIVIGYHLGGSLFDLSLPMQSKIVFPIWFYESNEEFREIFGGEQITYIPEFESKAERDRFNKDNTFDLFTGTPANREEIPGEQSFVLPANSRFEAFQSIFDVIRNIVLGIGIFFLVIAGLFILTTVGKIVADSKKEIGVFRAIGAQRGDIMKIFFSYTFLLTTLGFLIGLGLALIINAILSILYGNDIFYQIALYATSTGLRKPLFVLIGFPVIEVLGLYGFVLLAGFLAAIIPIISASRIDPIKALREE